MANYLYNGVELPDVYDVGPNESNHRLIYKGGELYHLVCCAKPIVYITGYGVVGIPRYNSAYVQCFHYNGRWRSEASDISFYRLDEEVDEYIWTSHDILYEDSTDIFLPRTDPILVPDTETVDPLDPTSLLMGYRVGQAIRGMRKKEEV